LDLELEGEVEGKLGLGAWSLELGAWTWSAKEVGIG